MKPLNRKKYLTAELYKLVKTMIESEKHSLKEIATTLDLSVQTVSRIATKIHLEIPFKDSSAKKKDTWKRKNNEFSAIDQAIFNCLSCNNSLIQKEISEKLLETTQSRVSASTISRKIKKMNFSRKRLSLIPVERNTVENIEARAVYSNEITRIPNENLIFLDESGFNEHTRRFFGYSPINSKAFINVPSNKNINKSLME